MILLFTKQIKAHFNIRQNFLNQSHLLAHCHSSKYKILRSDLKYFHTTIPLPIFAQTKTLIISIIKEMPVTCIHAVTSIPPLTSFPLSYIFIPLLFCTTAFSFTSAFCRVFGKCSFNSFLQFLRLLLQLVIHIPSVPAQQLVFYLFQIFHGN